MQATSHQPDKASMEIYVVIAFALIAIVGGVIFYNGSATPEPEKTQTAAVNLPATKEVTPQTVQQEPIQEAIEPTIEVELTPETAIQEPAAIEPKEVEVAPVVALPALDNSDKFILEKALQLSWLPNYSATLLPKEMLRNFVTFIDNLAQGELATKFTPLKKPAQAFSVRESGDELYLNEASYKRYTPYIDILNSLNIELAIEHYQQLMPLIDEAYMELGYDSGTFNQTLIRAIDMMLEAPMIREPITLVAPSAMYQFKDPELEQLPSAQKLMLRIGPNNATQLRPKLQQIQISLAELED